MRRLCRLPMPLVAGLAGFPVLGSSRIVSYRTHTGTPIQTTPVSEIAEQIFDRCMAEDPKLTGGIGGDNMTAIIVRFAF